MRVIMIKNKQAHGWIDNFRHDNKQSARLPAKNDPDVRANVSKVMKAMISRQKSTSVQADNWLNNPNPHALARLLTEALVRTIP
jgi:hypothetical protein